ncbi:hypothetical protein IW261DRAFT_1501933 [Armillaria novae-zelandiae]|uniref:DRBM domain-containing protein n=1 Tax=Armillaria novae-zelandiae TaxID=153914 RepID=A0AA39NXV7_9AGAR|nr:hypothetical protein IW261DRAFT_1501933 [Armillaria novae-zelandiae]
MSETRRDYRTELNNLCKQAGWEVVFEDTSTGPQHNVTWSSTATINGVAQGQGTAKTARAAREEASRQTLILLGRA